MREERIEIIGNNDNNNNQDDFYRKFKERLNEALNFPTQYVYKFIIPADQAKIAQIHAIFENKKPAFASKDSSKGKYTSITITMQAKDADEIIRYYQEVAALQGVVML